MTMERSVKVDYSLLRPIPYLQDNVVHYGRVNVVFTVHKGLIVMYYYFSIYFYLFNPLSYMLLNIYGNNKSIILLLLRVNRVLSLMRLCAVCAIDMLRSFSIFLFLSLSYMLLIIDMQQYQQYQGIQTFFDHDVMRSLRY